LRYGILINSNLARAHPTTPPPTIKTSVSSVGVVGVTVENPEKRGILFLESKHSGYREGLQRSCFDARHE
jgi:hypothetical protein